MTVLFECVAGSRLFGTDNEYSDTDLIQIVLPSYSQLLLGDIDFHLENHSLPSENKFGEIEVSQFSIKNYLDALASGNIKAIEILFTPPEMITITSKVWDAIIEKKDLLFSKYLGSFSSFTKTATDYYYILEEKIKSMEYIMSIIDQDAKISDLNIDPSHSFLFNKNGEYIEFQGKKYKDNMPQSFLYQGIENVLSKYSSSFRNDSKKKISKVLAHAIRITEEANEFLVNETILFPRKNKDFLCDVKNGKVSIEESQAYLNKLLEQNSFLIKAKTREYISKEEKKKAYKEILTLAHDMVVREHMLDFDKKQDYCPLV